MLTPLNYLLSLGIEDSHSIHERNQIKMVNFTSMFCILASTSFFFASLRLDSAVLSISLISYPLIFGIVMYLQSIKKYVYARNILYFSACAEITTFGFIENPSSFTLNYFFGIGMLAFIIFKTKIAQLFGFLVAMTCYFMVNYLQDTVQVRLEYDPVIAILDALTLFTAIYFCMDYFLRINKETNSIIMEQKIELEKININKDKLISILSHDIKGPINSINSLIHFNEQKMLTEAEMNELLSKIKVEFTKQFMFIENLLQWSQTQLNEINAVPTNVEIVSCIKDVESTFKHQIQKKGLTVTYDIIDSLTLKIDHTHFTIVIRNILSNAIKFCPINSEIIIRSYKRDKLYIIQIENQGLGFEEETLYSFNKNELLLKTTLGTQNEQGNGLGLAISKALLQKNNGNLNISNLARQGARVEISLNLH